MILPDPVIYTRPLHVWLGFLTFLLLLTQITLGIIMVGWAGMSSKVHFFHTRVIWIILLIIVLIHGFYGFEIYFLK